MSNRKEYLRALDDLERDIKYGPSPSDVEHDAVLAGIADESDADLQAAAELFGLEPECIEERAAIMQYDGGVTRVTANRLALTWELRRFMPDVSDALCRWFAQNSAAALMYGREHGLNRRGLADALHGYLRRKFGGENIGSMTLFAEAI